MATKDCPSCGAMVPTAAARCKHCFHDFTEAPPKKANGVVGFLGLVAAMAVVAGLVFWFVQGRAAAERIVIDEETSSIVFTKKYADRTETNRVRFDEVVKIEVVMGGEYTWEVVAVTLDGERHTLNVSDDASLQGYAEHVSSVMEKPLERIDEARGFGDLGTGGK